ncbi:MAG: hypothetical protein V3W37_08630 [Candidatus Binatia bacterium]
MPDATGIAANASTINALFAESINDPSELTKLAEAGGAFIRQKLRELSFLRKIIPPVMVTKQDTQRSTLHDGLTKVVDIEPDSTAVPLTWRGEPDARYVSGPRYEIGFFTVSSELFEKTEQELLAYESPITKIIEENSVKDIQEVEDRTFLAHADAALTFSGNTALVSDTTMTRNALTQLVKLIVADRLKLDLVLMTQEDFADVLAWDATDVGDRVASEITVDGYKYNTLLGYKLVTTIKNDIVLPGFIYGFAAPQFLGNFFILNQTKFWINKRANLVEWRSWEDIAVGIANVNGVARIELA